MLRESGEAHNHDRICSRLADAREHQLHASLLKRWNRDTSSRVFLSSRIMALHFALLLEFVPAVWELWCAMLIGKRIDSADCLQSAATALPSDGDQERRDELQWRRDFFCKFAFRRRCARSQVDKCQSGVMRKCYSRVSFILCVVAGDVCLCLPLSHLR